MHLSCCGITHRTSSLEDRESFQIARSDLARAVDEYRRSSGAVEAALISTCNRIEFYRADQDKTDIRESVETFYDNRGCEFISRLKDITLVRQGSSSARHLFKVAAGLDSALLGETQILGQVKEAYSAACSVNAAGKILHKLFHHAFQVAKRVRTETELGTGAQSLAGAAAQALRYKFGVEGKGLQVLVIGVNKTTELLLARLHSEGAEVTVANRTLYNADKIAKPYGFRIAPLEEIPHLLAQTQVVFSATSAPGYIIRQADLRAIKLEKSLYLIDLAVPRDIDPATSQLKGVILLDLDDLKRYLETLNAGRSAELPIALELIEEQVAAFEQWRRQTSDETTTDLRHLLDEDRRLILEKFHDQFRPGDHKALEAFSRTLFRQFLRRATKLDVD
ncbi:MAG: glutamyl-tRNA reductase [Calditrichota bacterium]